ncbi:uncharacterized protein LOC125842823 [Solanum stenotomum]|uniref:uncharacterized protein LOC125842823 n=1 Tax=Solanum stenotomum TaxID=172797 RepID=UPI0020D02F9F|nr:uncharacterized protein LOC125842823 [Solanum stenotomum]
MRLLMADQSIKHPVGIIYDILVKVDRFTFPVNEEEGTFNVCNSVKQPSDVHVVSTIDVIDEAVMSVSEMICMSEPLETVLPNYEEIEVQRYDEVAASLSRQGEYSRSLIKLDIDIKNRESPPAKPSLVEPPKLELKVIHTYLRYAFLGTNNTLPIIIAADLLEWLVKLLLEVLKRYIKAIRWTISNIVGIPPEICIHKIQLDSDCKPSVEHQRRLNPPMKEVVKKKIIKWLDADVVYPFMDIKWDYYSGTTKSLLHWKTKRKPISHVPIGHLPSRECHLDCAMLQRHCNGACFFAIKRMPFGLCNAPATLQWCMLSIFADMVEDLMEVFMDDFLVVGDSLETCLDNLGQVLQRYVETKFVLNWEKCQFIVKEGIVLGHKVSHKGMEVDKAKIAVIEKLPSPICIKGIQSFLGHVGFYRRFIKDFSKIAHPMCKMLEKEAKFLFDDAFSKAFECLKEKLISTPMIISPDWSEPFEVMCDASGTALGVVLGKNHNKLFHPIYYASKLLNGAHRSYTVTEQELLVVVYAFEKFRAYLLGTKVRVHTDHAALW